MSRTVTGHCSMWQLSPARVQGHFSKPQTPASVYIYMLARTYPAKLYFIFRVSPKPLGGPYTPARVNALHAFAYIGEFAPQSTAEERQSRSRSSLFLSLILPSSLPFSLVRTCPGDALARNFHKFSEIRLPRRSLSLTPHPRQEFYRPTAACLPSSSIYIYTCIQVAQEGERESWGDSAA